MNNLLAWENFFFILGENCLTVLVLALETDLDEQFHHPVCRVNYKFNPLYLLANLLAKVTDL